MRFQIGTKAPARRRLPNVCPLTSNTKSHMPIVCAFLLVVVVVGGGWWWWCVLDIAAGSPIVEIVQDCVPAPRRPMSAEQASETHRFRCWKERLQCRGGWDENTRTRNSLKGTIFAKRKARVQMAERADIEMEQGGAHAEPQICRQR